MQSLRCKWVTRRLFPAMLVIFFPLLFTSSLLYADEKLRDDLFGVSFPNEKDGWACGRWGCVLNTTDGGKTWTPQESGIDYTLSSIHFVDPKKGWAVGDEGTIIHTADGGKTWKKQESPVPFFLMDVHFENPLKGWIVTEQTHILFTDDGGKTWCIQFSDEDFILKSLSFCDPLHGWAVGEYGYIYHTRNGGATWEKQSGYFDISESTGEIEAGIFLFDVVAVNPRTAWAVGIDGCVIRTVDEGKIWQEVHTGTSKTQLFCIGIDQETTILIGGNGVFLSSTDHGVTWQSPACEPPITYGWLYGLSQRGSSRFVAVGWEGAIYLSSSNTWHRTNY
jgi:photosystem II stability/assembly factor-like uncharacterized protein